MRSAEPVFVRGGPIACLVLHGFGGSPAEVRPVIDHLVRKGFTVSAPVLPGHGAEAGELGRTRFRHWVRAAERELLRLQGEGRRTPVHLVGFSMGGLIALWLAARHGAASVTALAAPTLLRDTRQLESPLSRYLPHGAAPQPAVRSLARLAGLVRRQLPLVQAPVQALQGDRDSWIDPESGAYLVARAASQAKRLLLLPGRDHFLGLERGRDEVARLTAEWIEAHQA